MVTLTLETPEQTLALGEAWGQAAEPGWVFGLSGDLGAGKTQLVRGLARGLGCRGRVHSPTFGLMHEYEGGRCPLLHLDLYRLCSAAEVRRAGLEEALTDRGAVVAVEWFERWGLEALPWGREWLEAAGNPAQRNERSGGSGNWPFTRRLRWVWIAQYNDQNRRLAYEDFGA